MYQAYKHRGQEILSMSLEYSNNISVFNAVNIQKNKTKKTKKQIMDDNPRKTGEMIEVLYEFFFSFSETFDHKITNT